MDEPVKFPPQIDKKLVVATTFRNAVEEVIAENEELLKRLAK